MTEDVDLPGARAELRKLITSDLQRADRLLSSASGNNRAARRTWSAADVDDMLAIIGRVGEALARIMESGEAYKRALQLEAEGPPRQPLQPYMPPQIDAVPYHLQVGRRVPRPGQRPVVTAADFLADLPPQEDR